MPSKISSPAFPWHERRRLPTFVLNFIFADSFRAIHEACSVHLWRSDLNPCPIKDKQGTEQFSVQQNHRTCSDM